MKKSFLLGILILGAASLKANRFVCRGEWVVWKDHFCENINKARITHYSNKWWKFVAERGAFYQIKACSQGFERSCDGPLIWIKANELNSAEACLSKEDIEQKIRNYYKEIDEAHFLVLYALKDTLTPPSNGDIASELRAARQKKYKKLCELAQDVGISEASLKDEVLIKFQNKITAARFGNISWFLVGDRFDATYIEITQTGKAAFEFFDDHQELIKH